MNSKPLSFLLYLTTVISFILTTTVFADQQLDIETVDPKIYDLGAFNSYKHTLLIIAITQKNREPFDCHPNRYIFYDYGSEKYHETMAGNLKINGEYSRIIKTRILSLGRFENSNSKEWRDMATSIMNALNISAETMESAKMKSSDGSIVCWQQPELSDLNLSNIRSYPFLAANMCKHAWCNELYWLDTDNVQFWIQLKPKEFHLIELNTRSGTHQFKKRSSVFYKKDFPQLNAPRDNLITAKNINDGSVTLTSKKGKNIKLTWKSEKNGKITVSLSRSKTDSQSADQIRENISHYLRSKQIPQAFQTVKFGLWLDPNNREIKIERLKVYTSLLLFENFFDSLAKDFEEKDRFYACQKLHLDTSLRHLWQKESFSEKFKASCM